MRSNARKNIGSNNNRSVWPHVTLLAIMVIASGFLVDAAAQSATPPVRPQVRATPPPRPEGDLPGVVSRDSELEAISAREADGFSESAAGQDAAERGTNIGRNSPEAPDYKPVTTQAQQRMVFFLDLLTRTEQRAESLRKQLFEMIEKHNTAMTKIQQIEYGLRPEVISSYTALSGSLNPEDLRDQRKRTLEIERDNLNSLLVQIEASRSGLEENVRKADQLVERVRARFDAVLEAAFADDDEEP